MTDTYAIVTAPKRNSYHWTAGEVTWDEVLGWLGSPADAKECGNYVMGTLRPTTEDHSSRKGCTALHRTGAAIVSRSMLLLDADYAGLDFRDMIDMVWVNRLAMHTTWRSSPDDPRWRMLAPTDREMTPEEYHKCVEVVMHRLGTARFDTGSVQPERYMFRPSTQQPDWYDTLVVDGPLLEVDALLAEWTPEMSAAPMPTPNARKRSPFELEGVVGAFNRVYSIDEVITEFHLPYDRAGERRWHLHGASGEAGVTLVDDGLVYSHHANDPAWGQTCSAFDLVRLHRFGALDVDAKPDTPINRLPSHNAMLDLASVDHRVVAELVGADFSDEEEDLDWRLLLKLAPRTGKFIDCIENWDLVRKHLPVFAGLYYNEMTLAVETDRDLPWRPLSHGGPAFSETDRSALCHQLEREYHLRPSRTFINEIVDTAARERYVNPVRDYLQSLVWDGKPRMETCLPGVRPTAYTRMVARKVLVAAVARMLNPGCKWDHTLVLYGPEGLGKTYWVDTLARGFSATLGRIGDKDTLLIMQRSWIMLADEGHSLRKGDADMQKEFLTRTSDVFRIPFERETLAHPRHCVIWSSTNDEVFLRQQEGNRRFLIVHCEERLDFDRMTPEYVDQLWAEAVVAYRAGERLFLTEEESATAARVREHYTEEDALAGLLAEYLETPVPDDWDTLGPEDRRLWLINRANGLVPAGTHLQNETCSVQLWVEALGRRFGDHRRQDLLDIVASLKRVPGWEAVPGRHRVTHYGPQLVFRRTDADR